MTKLRVESSHSHHSPSQKRRSRSSSTPLLIATTTTTSTSTATIETSKTSSSSSSSYSSTISTAKKHVWRSVSYPMNLLYNLISATIRTTSRRTGSSNGPTSKEKERTSRLARLLRKRYLYTSKKGIKSTARAVFSKRWMRQALRWDFVGVSLSKCWGSINSQPLPVWARRPLYQMWGSVFKCNMDEVAAPLESYPTLGAFFSRQLIEGARPVTPIGMASPVDGRVISCGPVCGDLLEQVKGKTYSLSSFLGNKYDTLSVNSTPEHPTNLYQIIIYLSPGDYHRIHFPDDCTINKRRHFPGTLFPVNYPFLRMIPSLFALNERVVLMGGWKEGFFSLTAVGAYNVGSIELKFDQVLKTNQITRDFTCPNLEYFSWNGVGSYAYEKDYRMESGSVSGTKGEELGQFHFGSTVVLIFEAPGFVFDVQPGDCVKMGQKIGDIVAPK